MARQDLPAIASQTGRRNRNDGHGTFAAGLIAGNASFRGEWRHERRAGTIRARERWSTANCRLIGTAPDAQIYVVRVFGNDSSAGASTSTILAAIQHVIDQRVLYDDTRGKKGVKIEVANLSLGISTLAAGQTLLDQLR